MTVIHQDSTLLSVQLIFSQITRSKVLDILRIFKLRKASGLDSISHQMNVKIYSSVLFSKLQIANYKMGALDSQPQVIKFTSCLPMVGDSLRVLRLLPPLKLVAMI